MNKFTRFTLFAGMMAIGLAACGDDVQVVDPPAPEPDPLVVSLQPGATQIDVGETVDLAVNVSGGDQAETPTITCSASNGAVTVSAVGNNICRVTGVTEGSTATVTVVATRGTQSATAGANVEVLPDLTVPATVAIEKVTQGTLNTPVALNNIARQIEITVNINPGTQLVEDVILFFRGNEIARQTLTPAQVAEIRAAIAADAPEAQVLRTITFSWETDAYTINTGGTGVVTGSSVAVPNHLNGSGNLTAEITVDDGSADGTAVSSAPLNLTLRNLNGFHLQIERTGSTNVALDVQQFEWRGGMDASGTTNAGIDGHLVPVLYTPGVTLASAQFTFAGALRVLGAGPWTYVWSPAALAGYSMPVAGTAAFPNMLRDGEYPRVVGNGVLSDGQGMGPFGGSNDCLGVATGILNIEVPVTGLCAGGTAWSPPSATFVTSANQVDVLRAGERIDNLAPAANGYSLSSRPGLPDWPQVPTTGAVGDNGALVSSAGTWVNENLDFSGGGIYNGPGADTGVSRVVAGFPAPTFLAPIFEANGGTYASWTDISSDPTGMSLPETVTNTVYNVRVTDADALNNKRTQNLTGNAGTVWLGSDWTDPVLWHTAGISNPDRDGFDLLTDGAGAGAIAGDDLTLVAGPDYNYYVQWTDPINVGASGFTAFAGNPVFRQLHRVTPGGVAAVVTGSTSSTAVTPTWSAASGITNYGRATASQQPVACDVATPANCDALADILAGYYIYRAYVLDDAGNLSLDTAGDETIGSSLVRRSAVVDPVQPTVFGITSPVNMVGGSNVTFTSNASDNLDLGQSFLSLDYPAFLAGPFWAANSSAAAPNALGGYWTPVSTLAPVQGTTGGVRHNGAENEEGVIFDSPFEAVATLATATPLSRTASGFIRSIEWVCAGAGVPIATCGAGPGDWGDIDDNLAGPTPVGWFAAAGAPSDLAYAAGRPNLASFSQYDATRFDHVPATSGNVNPFLEQVAPDDAGSPFPHRSVSTAPINPVSILLNGGVGTEVSPYHTEVSPGDGSVGADIHTAWAISDADVTISGTVTPVGTPAPGLPTGGRTATFDITARLVTASTNADLKIAAGTGPGQNLFPGPMGRVDFFALEPATGTLRYLGMQNNPVVFENNPACVPGANQDEYRCWDFSNTFVVENWVGPALPVQVLAVGVNAAGDGLATFPVDAN